jgi:SAM-dependent methyltransferase
LTEAPPSGEAPHGLEAFLAVGTRLVERMEEAGLEGTDRVLDIGCGSGRIATALANVLTTGRYDGFGWTPVSSFTRSGTAPGAAGVSPWITRTYVIASARAR